MGVWIAEQVFDGEGSQVLGVYSSEDKAKEASAIEARHDLVWKRIYSNYFEAKDTYCSYDVYWVEVE